MTASPYTVPRLSTIGPCFGRAFESKARARRCVCSHSSSFTTRSTNATPANVMNWPCLAATAVQDGGRKMWGIGGAVETWRPLQLVSPWGRWSGTRLAPRCDLHARQTHREHNATSRRTIRSSLQYKLQTVKNVSLHIFQLVWVVVSHVYHRSSADAREDSEDHA